MSWKCLFGHKWNNSCKCEKCGATRDEQHYWNWCKCDKCGKVRDGIECHEWKGLECLRCGKIADINDFPQVINGKPLVHYLIDYLLYDTAIILIESGASIDVNPLNKYGRTPLMTICTEYAGATYIDDKKHLLFATLLEAGADINVKTSDGTLLQKIDSLSNKTIKESLREILYADTSKRKDLILKYKEQIKETDERNIWIVERKKQADSLPSYIPHCPKCNGTLRHIPYGYEVCTSCGEKIYPTGGYTGM